MAIASEKLTRFGKAWKALALEIRQLEGRISLGNMVAHQIQAIDKALLYQEDCCGAHYEISAARWDKLVAAAERFQKVGAV